MTDWNDLYAQAFPNLSGAAGAGAGGVFGLQQTPTRTTNMNMNNRTLADLHVANYTLFSPHGGGGGGATTPMSILRPPSAAATRTSLLWNNSTVPTTTGQGEEGANNNNTGGNGGDISNNNNNENSSMTMEEMVARLEQEVLDKILIQTDYMVRLKTDQMMEQQIQADWERDLNVWTRRELVGGRTLGGAAAGTAAGRHYPPLPLQASSTTTALAHGSKQHQQQQYGNNTNQYANLISATGSVWQSPMSSTTSTAAGSFRSHGTIMDRRVDVETLQAHVKIVAGLENTAASVPTAVAALIQVTDPSKNKSKASGGNSSSSRTSNPAQAGYATAWKWLQTLITSPTTRASLSSSLSSPDQATATLVHLCRQFQGRVFHRTRQATNAGQSLDASTTRSYNSDLATHCAFYVQLELGSGPSSDNIAGAEEQQQPPWPILYYCLRCGDARAALEVWQQEASSNNSSNADIILLPDGLYETIHRILSTMDGGSSGSGNSGHCFWEFGIPPIAAQDRRVVADWLENLLEQQEQDQDASTTTPVTATDDNDIFALHRQAFLTLLSGFDQLPSRDKMPGLSSIEDYLLGCLWKAVLQPNPVEEVVNLGNVIALDYGVNYFGDQGESGGWAFCLPLLATQRYATALTHLAEAGSDVGLMQAAHLALLLSKSGVPVVDLDRVVVSNDATTNANTSSDALVASLLVNFANRLLLPEPTAGPLAALEYLARIPNKNRARKEVASLIASTGDLSQLAGTVNPDGLRQDGDALNKHFSDQEQTLILKEAAELLSRDKSDKQKMGLAAMCYMLAGHYASVLVLLNEMLSPPNQPDENRKFWMEQTESFHVYYLKKRTRVLDVLEREGKLGLIQASHTMMEMNGFFEHMRAGRYAEAWAISERLGLLPRSQADVAVMENKYRNLDDSIKRVYPSLLLGAMETLYQEYTRIKTTTDLQGPNASVARERLRELQEKGRAIDTFAGLLGGVGQMGGHISSIAARMV